MRGFKEAAEFIGQWIKVQKHMATDFANDLPAVLERACAERGRALANPEATLVPPISIYLLNLEENESDYIVSFMLNLLEAVSDN
jgi:hypothetical protein